MKLDAGKLGRSYVLGLWLCIVAFVPIAEVRWIFKHSTEPFGPTVLNTFAADLVVVLLHGVAAWGVWKRRRLGYYLSPFVSAYWVVDAAYDFIAHPLPRAPRWAPVIPFILAGVALVWLATPALRSQFSLGFLKAKVA